MILVLSLTFVLFIPSLDNGFQSDDYDFLREVVAADHFSEVWNLFWTPLGGTVLRPVLHLSFVIDHTIAGLHAWYYHLENVGLHLLNTLLVYGLIRTWTRRHGVALAAALFFGIWPTHHESVTWIAGRTDVLATMWIFATLLAVTRTTRAVYSRDRLCWIVAASVFGLLAVLSKEIGYALVVLVPLTVAIASPTPRRWSNCFWAVGITGVLAVLTIGLRWWVLGTPIGGYNFGLLSVNEQLGLKDIGYWIASPYRFVAESINIPWLELTHRRISNITPDAILAIVVGLIIMGVIANAIRWKVDRRTVIILGVLLIAFYAAAFPSIHFLNGVKPTLEGSRVYYLPSMFGASILALLIVSLGRRVQVVGIVGITSFLIAALLLNRLPWEQAANESQALQRQLIPIIETQQISTLLISGITDNIAGAYVFRRGLEDMVYTFVPDTTAKVMGTGKNVMLPSCDIWQDPNLRAVEWNSTSLQLSSIPVPVVPSDIPIATIQTFTAEDLLTWKPSPDLEALETPGHFRVIGPDPYLTSPSLSLKPSEIPKITITMQPFEDKNRWALAQVYWSESTPPRFESYDNQQSYFIALNGQLRTDDVGVCLSPSWILQDQIRHLRFDPPGVSDGQPQEIVIQEIQLRGRQVQSIP